MMSFLPLEAPGLAPGASACRRSVITRVRGQQRQPERGRPRSRRVRDVHRRIRRVGGRAPGRGRGRPGGRSVGRRSWSTSLVVDAGALVLDRDARIVHQDRHRATSVAQRVLQQHVEDLADQARCCRSTRWVSPVVTTTWRRFFGELLLPVGDVVIDDSREIEVGPLAGGASCVPRGAARRVSC